MAQNACTSRVNPPQSSAAAATPLGDTSNRRRSSLDSVMLLLLLGSSGVITYLHRRLQQHKYQSAAIIRAKSEALAEQNQALALATQRLQDMTTTDPLTDLPNHRASVAALDREIGRAHRYGRPCTVLILDVDHFKLINDRVGHLSGDTALRQLATLVRKTLRVVDTLGRWGGEEFIAILPETQGDEALVVAERVRTAVAGQLFAIDAAPHLTCSVGMASYPQHGRDRDTLVQRADQALYVAKRLGRNQVRGAGDPAVAALLAQSSLEGSGEETALAGTVDALATLVEARDHYTGEHILHVAALSLRLAFALGLDAAQACMMEMTGRLHDVGKIAVPDAVLQKPGQLTAEEWALMHRHPVVGADVVSRVPALRLLAPLIRAHHERWDGLGYPDKLAGEVIPLGARIVAVADAYAAMTTNRPYRQAYEIGWALNEVRQCAGSQFDPIVVEALGAVLAADLAAQS